MLVGACAGAPVPDASNTDDVSAFFTKSYEKILETPLEEPSISQLTNAGLRSLSKSDHNLSIREFEGAVVISYEGREIQRLPTPPEGETEAWGEMTAAALITAWQVSPLLQARDSGDLYDAFMRDLVPLLGESATYWTAEEYERLVGWKPGNIDILYQSVVQGVEIVRLDPEGRLEEAGLRVGDIITHIDGTETSGHGGSWHFYVGRLLNGSQRTQAKLTIIRQGQIDPLTISVQRKRGTQETWEMDARNGVVDFKIWELGFRSLRNLRDNLAELEFWGLPDDSSLQGILIDLRLGNKRPAQRDTTDIRFGAEMAAAFLPDGTQIATKKARDEDADVKVISEFTDLADGAPLIVLIDGSTASRSELFAAAVQDIGRALIIGTSSVGHGIENSGVELSNGGWFGLPTYRLFTPAGYGIEGRGVMPNICTSKAGATLEGLLQALRRGEALIGEADRTRNVDPDDKDALAAHRALCPPIADSNDLARELGFAILRDPALYARLMGQAGPG